MRESKKLIWPFSVFLVTPPFLIVYLLTTNQIFSFDAVTNAIACETNEPIRWFHPNHPLYPSLGVLWYRIERVFGYDGLAIYSLARMNSALVALGLGILHYSIVPFSNRFRALIPVWFLGSTFAVWHYAVDGRAIGVSLLFAALLFLFWLPRSSKHSLGSKDLLVMSLLSTVYILIHGIAIFHIFAVAFFIWRNEKPQKSGFARLGKASAYLALVFGFLLVIYTITFFFLKNLAPDLRFLSWSLGYAGFEGADKALESGFWTFNWGPILSGFWLGWKNAFLGPGKFSSYAPFVSTVFGLGTFVFFGFLAGCFIFPGPQKNKFLVQTLMMWGWLALFFLSFWSPGQEGFRIHVLIPWIMAAAIYFANSRPFHRIVALAATLVFTLNLTGPMYFNADIKNNRGFQTLREIDSGLNPHDVLLSMKGETIPGIEVLKPYFFPKWEGGSLEGRLMAFKEVSLDPLKARLDLRAQEGRRIFLAEDFFNGEKQMELENKMGWPRGTIEEFLGQFSSRNEWILSTDLKIYEVKAIP